MSMSDLPSCIYGIIMAFISNNSKELRVLCVSGKLWHDAVHRYILERGGPLNWSIGDRLTWLRLVQVGNVYNKVDGVSTFRVRGREVDVLKAFRIKRSIMFRSVDLLMASVARHGSLTNIRAFQKMLDDRAEKNRARQAAEDEERDIYFL